MVSHHDPHDSGSVLRPLTLQRVRGLPLSGFSGPGKLRSPGRGVSIYEGLYEDRETLRGSLAHTGNLWLDVPMRIHTDTLLTGDFYDAARAAGVTINHNSMHNSRSRDRAFDFSLRGDSARYPMGGRDSEGLKAATWDQWGIFLSVLFGRDSNARVSGVYEGLGEFEHKTFYRFSEGDHPVDMHGDHRWEYHAPYVQKCQKCDAKMTYI